MSAPRVHRPGLGTPTPAESGFDPLADAEVRAAGFRPAKQIMGTTVFRLATRGMWNCGATPFAMRQRLPVLEVPVIQDIRARCRRTAYERLAEETVAAGGVGAVGVRLGIGTMGEAGHEYLALGTAVHTAGRVRPARPFLCGLGGRRFAALIRGGWVPCGIAVGVGVTIRHDDIRTRLAGFSFGNQELPAWTEMVSMARARARQMLLEDCARIGGEGIVLHENDLSLTGHECVRTARNWMSESSDVQDHMATAVLTGTAVVPFAAGAETAPPRLVVRLDR
jgi:uncharacterized protein YbjQ (UPF0145 family)